MTRKQTELKNIIDLDWRYTKIEDEDPPQGDGEGDDEESDEQDDSGDTDSGDSGSDSGDPGESDPEDPADSDSDSGDGSDSDDDSDGSDDSDDSGDDADGDDEGDGGDGGDEDGEDGDGDGDGESGEEDGEEDGGGSDGDSDSDSGSGGEDGKEDGKEDGDGQGNSDPGSGGGKGSGGGDPDGKPEWGDVEDGDPYDGDVEGEPEDNGDDDDWDDEEYGDDGDDPRDPDERWNEDGDEDGGDWDDEGDTDGDPDDTDDLDDFDDFELGDDDEDGPSSDEMADQIIGGLDEGIEEALNAEQERVVDTFSTHVGGGTCNQSVYSLDGDTTNRKLANALAHTIGRIADAPTGVAIEGDEEWDVDALLMRRFNGRNLRSCRVASEKACLIFLMDTSPSCLPTAALFASIASMAAERGDCLIYSCPNGTIDGQWNAPERRWEALDQSEFNVLSETSTNTWGYDHRTFGSDTRWIFKNQKICFFGDFDGVNIIRNSAELNTVYWFCNVNRKYEFDGYEADLPNGEAPYWWPQDRWFQAREAEDIVFAASQIR